MICLCQNITPSIFWGKQIIAKLYRGCILAQTNHNETILVVEFNYDSCSETVLGGIFWLGILCTPVLYRKLLLSAVRPVVSVDSFLYAQLILYANNTELMLLCI